MATLVNLTTLFIKKFTLIEIQAKREKSVCYNCDEKYTPSHMYGHKELYMLLTEDDNSTSVPLRVPSIDLNSLGEPPQEMWVFLQAILGVKSHHAL